MKHLGREELVDIAEGAHGEASVPHLTSCAICRDRLSCLRAMMSRASAVEVPEPSPSFWDQLSSGIHDAVAREGEPERLSWAGQLRRQVLDSGVPIRLLFPVTVAAAAALVFAVLVMNPPRTPVAVPLPTATESAIPSEAVEGTGMLPPDDPTLNLVADLGTELDWEQIHDAGLVVHTGLLDRAVGQLSARERAELGKLLKLELGGSN